MASQTPLTRSGRVVSIADAFPNKTQQEFLRTMLKDIIDLRNSVDAVAARLEAVPIQRAFTVDAPDAKDAAVVHAAVAADYGVAKLALDIGTSDLDTVVAATSAGTAGNSITVQATGDSGLGAGVDIVVVSGTVHIHYESGVSTVADVEAAIDALSDPDDIILINTPGTALTVLTAPGDDFVATPLAGGVASPLALPGPFTNPDVPRNLRLTFESDWEGGDVTVFGTNQFDEEISEDFSDDPGNVVVGVKMFKTVTGATREFAIPGLNGPKTMTIGTGDKLGVSEELVSGVGTLFVDGVQEDVTVDTTNSAFTPTSAPDGARVFEFSGSVSDGEEQVAIPEVSTTE